MTPVAEKMAPPPKGGADSMELVPRTGEGPYPDKALVGAGKKTSRDEHDGWSEVGADVRSSKRRQSVYHKQAAVRTQAAVRKEHDSTAKAVPSPVAPAVVQVPQAMTDQKLGNSAMWEEYEYDLSLTICPWCTNEGDECVLKVRARAVHGKSEQAQVQGSVCEKSKTLHLAIATILVQRKLRQGSGSKNGGIEQPMPIESTDTTEQSPEEVGRNKLPRCWRN